MVITKNEKILKQDKQIKETKNKNKITYHKRFYEENV